MAKKPVRRDDLPVWAISHIKGTPARELGRVQAPTAEEAIEAWAATYNLTGEQKKRLAARRVT